MVKFIFKRKMRRFPHAVAASVFSFLCLPAIANAQDPADFASVEDLQNVSIEDLANVEVTSLSKRPERLSQAADSIYVITADDIRRSGATTLPEVLRLAPNLEVARINAYAWAVTARGFNMPEVGNKLLVLVNGRSVYEPISSGVLWEQIAVDLGSIERVEVISGPGGTMWGANAMNGVINIITKNSADAQGLSADVTIGHYERNAAIRYGGRISEGTTYQLYVRASGADETTPALPTDLTSDAFRSVSGGIRLHGRLRDTDTWSARAAFYDNNIVGNYNLNGRWLAGSWERVLSETSVISVNAFASYDERHHPVLDESRDTYTVNFQQDWKASQKHHVVWGAEVRHSRQMFDSLVVFRFIEPTTRITVGSLFAQDEIALKQTLKLTLGLKAEYSSYSGLEWLPNARLAWSRENGALFWTALARAVRTPARAERELMAEGIFEPNPEFGSEKLTAIEAGWRSQPTPRSSVSVNVFYNLYDDLRVQAYPPSILPITFANGAQGNTYGIEVWGKYDLTDTWRLSGGFNTLKKEFEVKPGFNDLSGLYVQGKDPGYQMQVRSQWDVTDRFKVDVALRNVGKVDRAPVPAYTEADVRLAWKLDDKLEFALTGLNLLNPRHIEVWNPSNTPPRYISRSVFASLRYGY